MNDSIFVYGTLMSGFRNPFAQQLHQNARFKGQGYFLGWLYDLGSYPGAIHLADSVGRVWGEVWELHDFSQIIPSLDEYEGIHDLSPQYVRVRIPVFVSDAPALNCWTYLLCEPTETLVLIPEGNYRKWLHRS